MRRWSAGKHLPWGQQKQCFPDWRRLWLGAADLGSSGWSLWWPVNVKKINHMIITRLLVLHRTELFLLKSRTVEAINLISTCRFIILSVKSQGWASGSWHHVIASSFLFLSSFSLNVLLSLVVMLLLWVVSLSAQKGAYNLKCIIIKSSASWCKAQLCCVLRAEWEDEQETLGCQLVSASVGLTLQTMISTAWSGREWNCSGSWRIWWDLTSSSFPMSINRAKTLKNSRSPLSGTDRSFTLPQRAHTFFCDALIQTDKTIK